MVVSVSMVEIGRRICQSVVGRHSEIVGRRVVDAGLAAGGIAAAAAGWAIAVVVGAAADAGWAIVAVAAVVAV